MRIINQEKLLCFKGGVSIKKDRFRDIDNEELDTEPSKKKSKRKIIIPIIILVVIAAVITAMCYFSNTPSVIESPETTTQASEWIDSDIQKEKIQEEKYPDCSLAPITVE